MRVRYAAPLMVVGSFACTEGPRLDPCNPIDPVLASSAFVVVVEPTPGMRISSPLQVRGCSRTHESNVVWVLRSHTGAILASGHTSGGGFAGAAPFSFSASFSVSAPDVGRLEVFERDESDGEGFPGGRSVVPVVLLPGQEESAGAP